MASTQNKEVVVVLGGTSHAGAGATLKFLQEGAVVVVVAKALDDGDRLKEELGAAIEMEVEAREEERKQDEKEQKKSPEQKQKEVEEMKKVQQEHKKGKSSEDAAVARPVTSEGLKEDIARWDKKKEEGEPTPADEGGERDESETNVLGSGGEKKKKGNEGKKERTEKKEGDKKDEEEMTDEEKQRKRRLDEERQALKEKQEKAKKCMENLIIVEGNCESEEAAKKAQEAVEHVLDNRQINHIVSTMISPFELARGGPLVTDVSEARAVIDTSFYNEIYAARAFLPMLVQREHTTYTLTSGGLAHATPTASMWLCTLLKHRLCSIIASSYGAECGNQRSRSRPRR